MQPSMSLTYEPASEPLHISACGVLTVVFAVQRADFEPKPMSIDMTAVNPKP